MPPKAGHIKKTPQERKAADLAYRKAKNAAMTPEEKEEFKKKNRKTQEAIRDDRTPEQTDLSNEKARDKRKEKKENELKMADAGEGGGLTESKADLVYYNKAPESYITTEQSKADSIKKIKEIKKNKELREKNEIEFGDEDEDELKQYNDYMKRYNDTKENYDKYQEFNNDMDKSRNPDLYDYTLNYGGGYSENLPDFETKNDYKVDTYDYILNSPNAPSAPYILNPNAPNISLSEEAYNVMKNTKKIIKETKMLTGKNKGTLFNGEDLDDESKHDDDEDMTTGATQSGYERNQNARANTDIPDMSDFNFERYAEAGADELPLESTGRRRKPIREESDFRRSNRRRSQGINDPLDDEGAYSNNYAGSNAALQINGYGRPAMPQFNNPNRTRERNPNQSMDGLDQQNPEPEEDRIQNEISNLMNLNMGDNDSIDNPLNMESLLRRMKSANRGDSSMRGFRDKNKWNPTIGRGSKLKGIKTMSNSLSSIRESQIPYKQPNRSYKGDAVNLIKKGNATITKIINQYQP